MTIFGAGTSYAAPPETGGVAHPISPQDRTPLIVDLLPLQGRAS